jgi:hypothetical protein
MVRFLEKFGEPRPRQCVTPADRQVPEIAVVWSSAEVEKRSGWIGQRLDSLKGERRR